MWSLFYIKLSVVETMKLLDIDRKIIKALNGESSGLSEKRLCVIIGVEKNNRSIINKRVNKLFKNGVVDRIETYPTIYYIRTITDIRQVGITKVKCIKCGNMDMVLQGQDTKVCSKCRHRYWVTNKRKIDYYSDITFV